MAEHAATMSWYDEMVAAGRSKSLTTGNIRCGVAAVHEVLGSLALRSLSLRSKTETKRLNFGLSPVLSSTSHRSPSSLMSSASHR